MQRCGLRSPNAPPTDSIISGKVKLICGDPDALYDIKMADGRRVSLFLLFSLIFGFCTAEAPGNCEYSDILGTWQFQVGEGNHNNTINCDKIGKNQMLP